MLPYSDGNGYGEMVRYPLVGDGRCLALAWHMFQWDVASQSNGLSCLCVFQVFGNKANADPFHSPSARDGFEVMPSESASCLLQPNAEFYHCGLVEGDHSSCPLGQGQMARRQRSRTRAQARIEVDEAVDLVVGIQQASGHSMGKREAAMEPGDSLRHRK
eukprot:g27547.t1